MRSDHCPTFRSMARTRNRKSRIKDGFLELWCEGCLAWKVATEFRVTRVEKINAEHMATIVKERKLRSLRCATCERILQDLK